LKNVLFITHENLSKTAVSKAMFEDVAHVVKNDGITVSILSAGDQNSSFKLDDVNYYTFKRSSYGDVSISAFLSLVSAFFIFLKLLFKNDVFLFRSYPSMMMFGWVVWLFGKKSIFDTRGLFFDELFDSGKISNQRLKRIFYMLENMLLRVSHKVISVTDAQAEHYISRVSSTKSKSIVIPNGAPRCEIIKSKTESDILQLVYVGSLVKWHSPELVRDVCLELKLHGISFHLTVLTRDLDTAVEVFSALDTSVSIETHDYRNKPIRFHYGFCFISGGVSKEVCFPVKYLEYIQSGTKVISSSNVKVTHHLTTSLNLGVSVDITNHLDTVVAEILDEIHSNKNNIVSLPEELTFESQSNAVKNIITSFK